MRHIRSLSFLLILLCFPSYGHAQLWSGIIAPSRATNWSTAGVEGGIPSATWTQCGSTIAAYTGTGQTIQTAINNCTANHYVQLGAGTFTLSSGFTVSRRGVVVRGMGANNTFLIINGASPISCGYFYMAAINICGASSVPYTSANWTAGYAQGTTRITLSSTTNLSVGSVIQLEQLDDASDGWPAAGDLFICTSNVGPCSSQGGGYGFGWANRANAQFVKVTNLVGGGQVDISPPITLPNFRSGQSPGAHWASSVGNTLVNAGLENLSVDQTGVGQTGIVISNALNCWVKGVRSIYNGPATSFNNAFELISSMHITIRDSYIFGPTSVAVATYPVSPNNTGNILFENNILHGISGDIVTDGPTMNSVFSYNFFPGIKGPGFVRHGAGEALNLYEGNVSMGWWSDVNHGTSAFNTIFRNAMIGNRYNGGPGATISSPVHLQSHNRFYNVIGNVMGDFFYNAYESNLANNGNAIYVLGWQGNASGTGTPPNDTNVKRTLMRWGNWDSVTNATRWCGNSSNTGWSATCSSKTEVPSGITNFSNPIPAAETLPASFYLSAKPSWWPSAKAWPPIGPDVIGGNITNMAGHAHTNPAADCYLNVMGGPANGSGNPLTFNPDACYGNPSVPAAPTGLNVK